ncbi:Arylsulfatase A [Halovenus aranensis]|uniref:Arylsulfatase A n=1 Tax=Halovenus aranensis TaxID=890420 RepID=A0A1G8ZK39_9EURY|nr:sulfatase [Halovenus aranensis]SDK15489.1 Arylsulfatase A [Halovenus aranensis]
MTKNSLLITIDSVRLDVLSDDSFPIISTLRDNGDDFGKTFATGPGTTPSFPAMLTGTMPLSYGGLGPLTEERPLLSHRQRQAGYTTGGFQCNPFLSRHFNYDVGFERFEDYQNPLMGIATKVFPRGVEINNPKLRRIDETLHITDFIKKTYQLIKGKPRPYVSADVITNDAIDWLAETESPFFGWVHYMDVHHPCFPPETYRKQYGVADVTQTEVSEWYSDLLRNPETLTEEEIHKLKQLYKAAIDYTLEQIARIITHLKESGRYEETLIILTSDHGELFGEFDQYGKPERMYDELLRVPLIVSNGPPYLEEATDQLVSLLDIPPLIHDTLNLEIPSGYEGQIPGKDAPRKYIMAEHEVEGDIIVGARSEEWLYEGDEIHNEHRLFDLRKGKFEQVSVSEHPEAEEVKSAVLDRLDTLDVDAHDFVDAVDNDVESRLENLGYL